MRRVRERRSKKDLSAFGRLVRDHLDAIGASAQRFAHQVGLSAGALSHIMYGDKPAPPAEKAKRWAEKLGLTGDARQRLLAAAAADRREADLRRVPELAEEIEGQRKEIERLRAEVERLRAAR